MTGGGSGVGPPVSPCRGAISTCLRLSHGWLSRDCLSHVCKWDTNSNTHGAAANAAISSDTLRHQMSEAVGQSWVGILLEWVGVLSIVSDRSVGRAVREFALQIA